MKQTAKKWQRGETLMELCIVLALIAIISTTVVTFCIVFSYRSTVAIDSKNFVSDLTAVRQMLNQWTASHDREGVELYSDRGSLYAIDGGEVYRFYLENKVVYAEMGQASGTRSIPVERADQLYFSLEKNNRGSAVMIYCSLSYLKSSLDKGHFTQQTVSIMKSTRAISSVAEELP